MGKIAMKLYAMRDRLMDQFTPFVMSARNDDVIQRELGDRLHGSDSDQGRHPEHFDLYVLAEYDQQTGQIVPLQMPVVVCCIADLFPKKEA